MFLGGIEKEIATLKGLSNIDEISGAAHQRCSEENCFWKYVASLQENTHTKVWFQ